MIISEKTRQMITNGNSWKKKYKWLMPTENIKAHLELVLSLNVQLKTVRYDFGNKIEKRIFSDGWKENKLI